MLISYVFFSKWTSVLQNQPEIVLVKHCTKTIMQPYTALESWGDQCITFREQRTPDPLGASRVVLIL